MTGALGFLKGLKNDTGSGAIMPKQIDSNRFYWNGKQWVPSGTTVIGILDKPALVPWASGCAVDYLDIAYNDPDMIWGDVKSKAREAYCTKGQEARDYGTFIHWMCERFLTTGNPEPIPATFEVEQHTIDVDFDLTHKFMEGFDYTTPTGRNKHAVGFYDWCTKNKINPLAVEDEVLHPLYGGRLDLVCEMNGVITLIDFKTGRGSYYDTWKYQLAGYRNAWDNSKPKRMTNTCCLDAPYHKIEAYGILKFNKSNGRINYRDFTEYQTTRTIRDLPRKPDGKLYTEKYTRNYEIDLETFMGCVDLWWLINRGMKKPY